MFYPNFKKLVLVDAYNSRLGMIRAARRFSVEVVELQHGVISKFHIGYSYGENLPQKTDIPDKILLWNDFWLSNLESVLDQNLEVFVNKQIELKLSACKGVVRDRTKILIISQGAISEKLSSILLENIKSFEKYKLIYKLHPSEFDSWESNEYLQLLYHEHGVEIVSTGAIYRLLFECGYQIGVFSTAIIEGLQVGCKLILVGLPGAEYWEGFNISYVSFSSFIGSDIDHE